MRETLGYMLGTSGYTQAMLGYTQAMSGYTLETLVSMLETLASMLETSVNKPVMSGCNQEMLGYILVMPGIQRNQGTLETQQNQETKDYSSVKIHLQRVKIHHPTD